MKTYMKTIGVILIAASAAISGCKKDDTTTPTYSGQAKPPYDLGTPENADVPEKVPPMTDGKTAWQVSKLILHREIVTKFDDHTADFAGWSFVFDKNGGVYATKKGQQVIGKWSNGQTLDYKHLVIDFGSLKPFNELNNVWTFTKQSETTRMMTDNDNMDGITGDLIFQAY